MITLLTVSLGLALFSIMILNYELKRTLRKIKEGIEPLTKDGGMYPKTKPVQCGELTRTVWGKVAPLHHVIKK